MSLISSAPKSGKTGAVVYALTRYGVVERELVVPRNVQAPEQQEIRSNFARVTGRWRILNSQQRAAWRVAPPIVTP